MADFNVICGPCEDRWKGDGYAFSRREWYCIAKVPKEDMPPQHVEKVKLCREENCPRIKKPILYGLRRQIRNKLFRRRKESARPWERDTRGPNIKPTTLYDRPQYIPGLNTLADGHRDYMGQLKKVNEKRKREGKSEFIPAHEGKMSIGNPYSKEGARLVSGREWERHAMARAEKLRGSKLPKELRNPKR